MPIMLPEDPPYSMGVRPITAKNELSPAFAGADQELLRKGSRYELAFDHGEMDYIDALAWADLMVEGETAVAPVFQPGLDTGAPGVPVVNGAGQAGLTLLLRGLSPGYVIRKGQFLSVISGGQRFLYRAAGAAAAQPDGTVGVRLYTLLRRPHPDGSVVELAQPMVEGFLRDVSDLTVIANHDVKVAFKIRERE